MSTLTEVDKIKLERILMMHGGYVLDFTNQTFQSFISRHVKLDIYSGKYSQYGNSKGKRFKSFWEKEGDITVGKILEQML